MTCRGFDNLRVYLSRAVLPQMVLGIRAPGLPPAEHKTHANNLTVRPEPYRKLESIYQSHDKLFYALIFKCKFLNFDPCVNMCSLV
jgi:hypothetical protein